MLLSADNPLCSGDAGSLRPFRSILHLEGDRLAFSQRLETRVLNRAEMYKDICTAIILGDKTETFGFVEPLYSTCSHMTFYLEIIEQLVYRVQVMKQGIQEGNSE